MEPQTPLPLSSRNPTHGCQEGTEGSEGSSSLPQEQLLSLPRTGPQIENSEPALGTTLMFVLIKM